VECTSSNYAITPYFKLGKTDLHLKDKYTISIVTKKSGHGRHILNTGYSFGSLKIILGVLSSHVLSRFVYTGSVDYLQN
jgi:hypothetical protein